MVNKKKMKAAIAFLAERTKPGKVKLFKLLYFADFIAYAKWGKSITEDTYENFEMGPVPRALWRNLDRYAEVTPNPRGGPLTEQRIGGKDDATLQALSEEEVGVLQEVIRKYGHLTGAQLRDLTHIEVPYRATQRGEEIPYFLAPYRDVRRPTIEEVNHLLSNSAYIARLRKNSGSKDPD